jgi:hypothetical protein
MDPFIERQRWSDFHHRIIPIIADELMPLLRPNYMALVEERVYLEQDIPTLPSAVQPDITVAGHGSPPQNGGRVATVAPPAVVPLPLPEEQSEPFIEVRRRDSNDVVAVLEVLSPANKRPGSDGRREYLAKRRLVLGSRAHLVELDLLRGGERLPTLRPLPPGDYHALVSRAQRRPNAEVWSVSLREPLPVIPIPLAGKDPDVVLDLQAVFNTVYERAGYDYSLDYRQPPEPPLNEADATWAADLLAANR